MKCAYCKQTIPEIRDANEEPKERTYTVEINGVECEIWMHDECVCKALGEYFSRKPEVTPASNDHITITPNDYHPWTLTTQPLTWDCGGTLEVEKPSQTKVWCNTDDESSHTPWRDRVD